MKYFNIWLRENIYYEKITKKEYRTPEDDWLKAENLLKGSKKN